MRLSLISEATLDQVERRIPVWIKKYFDGDQQLAHKVISEVIQADPTKGKYSEWLIRQWKNGTARFPEDTEKLSKNLSLFHKKKSRLPEKDINKYTPAQLSRALEENLGLTKSQRKKARGGSLEVPPGAEYLGKVRNVEVVKITTPEASSKLCSGTAWCTANERWAKEYLKEGPLFLIYVDGERKYLLHYEKHQFMDVHDERIESEQLFPLLNLISDLTEYEIENTPRLAVKYAEDIIGGRWPEGEPAIARDPEAAVMYAQAVIKDRFPEVEPTIAKSPKYAEWYANEVIEGRWPEAEPTIARDPARAYLYAKDVIRGRFPQGEPAIATNPARACAYARSVIGGRWPEVEPIIAKNPETALAYARTVVRGRWPQGEPAIARDPESAVSYVEDFIRGRWPKAEPAIAKNPETAYRYAKDVIKDRFPAGEPAIAKDPGLAAEYKRFVQKTD